MSTNTNRFAPEPVGCKAAAGLRRHDATRNARAKKVLSHLL